MKPEESFVIPCILRGIEGDGEMDAAWPPLLGFMYAISSQQEEEDTAVLLRRGNHNSPRQKVPYRYRMIQQLWIR